MQINLQVVRQTTSGAEAYTVGEKCADNVGVLVVSVKSAPVRTVRVVVLLIKCHIVITRNYNLVPAKFVSAVALVIGVEEGILMRLSPEPFVELFNFIFCTSISEVASVN